MLQQIILLLADAWAIVCIARMLLQWGGLNSKHPLMLFCRQTSEWLLGPTRRLLPPFKLTQKWDLACLLAAGVIYYLAFLAVIFLSLPAILPFKIMLAAAALTIISLTKATAYALMIGLFVRMLLSFTQPANPLLHPLQSILEPLSRPFVVFRIGRYDFSGSIVILVLWLWTAHWAPQLINWLSTRLLW